jgi:pimeloyl-ACP methyl ester carboxylesterase
MTAPTLVLVPGLWEGPTVYDSLREILAKAAPPIPDCHPAPLRSTGTTTPGNPTMLDDIQGIREVVEPLVQAGKRVVVVAHSAGGFLGSAAVEGLEVGGKDTKGSGGGVEKMFFIAAGIAPAGTQHRPQPFMDFQAGFFSLCGSAISNAF